MRHLHSLCGLWLVLTSLLLTAPHAAAGPRVDLVVSAEATSLEQQAALLTAGYLQRLYGADTRILNATASGALPDGTTPVILVGNQTNRSIRTLENVWPGTGQAPSEQGHLIRSFAAGSRPGLVIGGGSPRATYWAASEFGYRLGVRSLLDQDLDPMAPPDFHLDGFQVALEPALSIRSWTLSLRSPCAAAGWGGDELRRFLSQLARLKFNHLRVSIDASQPFLPASPAGAEVDRATVKRAMVDRATTDRDRLAGIDLFRGDRIAVSGDTLGRKAFGGARFFECPYLKEASTDEARGQAAVRFLTHTIEVAHEYGMQVSLEVALPDAPPAPPAPQPESKPESKSKSARQQSLRTVIGTQYPALDSIELRGAARLAATSDGNAKQPFVVLTAEPLKQAGSASQQPAAAGIAGLSLHRAAVLPTLALHDARQRLDAIRSAGPAGVSILEATLGDAELSAFWLCRAGFDHSVTTQQACRDLVLPVCGEGVPERVLKAFDLIEQATLLLNDELPADDRPAAVGSAFRNTFCPQRVSDVMAGTQAPPEAWSKARDCYLNAMNEMYRANTRAREGSRVYTLYWARRCEFAMEYMNCLEAVRKAGLAKQAKDKAAEVAELEKAIESLNGGLNALAAVARSSSDRGLIAVLNEDLYRPLKQRLEEADE